MPYDGVIWQSGCRMKLISTLKKMQGLFMDMGWLTAIEVSSQRLGELLYIKKGEKKRKKERKEKGWNL